MIRPLVVKQRRKRQGQKKSTKIYSQQELAQLNLIEISNTDFNDQFREQIFTRQATSPQLQIAKPIKLQQISQKKVQAEKKQQARKVNKSVQCRMSVTQKITESFKAGKRPSLSDINTGQVCVIQRKLPLNTSSFMLLDQRKEQAKINYRPRPSLNSRTFFNKEFVKRNERQSRTSGKRRLVPIEQASYWYLRK